MAIIFLDVSYEENMYCTYHTTSTLPMITTEAFVHDDIVLQPGNESLYGVQDDNTIRIIDNEYPIIQNIPIGDLQVWDEFMTMGIMQNAPPNVRVLTSDPNGPNIAYLWVVEEGDTVAGATVPGQRIGTLLFTDGFAALSPEGLRLVDQLLAYALGVEEIRDTSIHDYMFF